MSLDDVTRERDSYLNAFFAATVAALVVDATLQLAMDAVRLSTSGRAPWWITANLVERGRWVAFAVCLRWTAHRLDWTGEVVRPILVSSNQPWWHVGTAVIVVPVLWIVATWAVTAVRFTLLGTWDTDGRVFLSADYYSGLLVGLTPWLLAGAAVMATARHMD